MIVEFAGLTHERCTLVERFRRSPTETKADIIERVLSSLLEPSANCKDFLDLGQGAKALVGETLMLFLPGTEKRREHPDAVATARADGLYMDGLKFEASRGSPLHPAMRMVQERKGHRNEKGEIVQLSAFRQWYVVRDGKLVQVGEIKDPALSRRRGRTESLVSNLTAEELGL
jgi:hypothetical protein